MGLFGLPGCGLSADEIIEGIISDDIAGDVKTDEPEDVVDDQQKDTAIYETEAVIDHESESIADKKLEDVVNDDQENEAGHDSVDKIIFNDVTELSHGEVTGYDNWVYEALAVEFHEEIHRVGSPARASGKLVVALVRIKNVADSERQLGASFFAAEDEIGIAYSMQGLIA